MMGQRSTTNKGSTGREWKQMAGSGRRGRGGVDQEERRRVGYEYPKVARRTGIHRETRSMGCDNDDETTDSIASPTHLQKRRRRLIIRL
jgi:hypothetical protein